MDHVRKLARVARGTAVLAVLVSLAAPGVGAGSDEQQPPKHCLWRVRSVTNTIYLLGSIHIMKPDAFPLPTIMESAFDSSSLAIFEVDFTAEGSADAAVGALAAGMLPEGETLRDVVTPETYRLTQQRLASVGYDIGRVERMRPWMVATTLALAELTRAGYSSADGIDRYFQRRALEAGKRVEGLETIEFQLSLFADMTREEDEAFLVETLHELETVIPLVDELTGDWRAGRIAEVEELLKSGYDGFPRLFAKLVTARNRTWVARLEELLAGSERAFVVVGALHLVGDQGIVELLRRKGYEVEQL
jgi:uncharacterized protein YbaP (TraB family)